MIYAKNEPFKEALILDHMSQYGWRDIINKKSGLDLEHVNKVMNWLAKFHGLSYVLLNNHPEGPEGWLEANSYGNTMPMRLLKLGKNSYLHANLFD